MRLMKIGKLLKNIYIPFISLDDVHMSKNLVKLIYKEILEYEIAEKNLLLLLIMQVITM